MHNTEPLFIFSIDTKVLLLPCTSIMHTDSEPLNLKVLEENGNGTIEVKIVWWRNYVITPLFHSIPTKFIRIFPKPAVVI